MKDVVQPCLITLAGRPIGDVCESCRHALMVHILSGEKKGVCSICEIVAELRAGFHEHP